VKLYLRIALALIVSLSAASPVLSSHTSQDPTSSYTFNVTVAAPSSVITYDQIPTSVRKIILIHVSSQEDGLKGLVTCRHVARFFHKDTSDPALWTKFLPKLGLSPNMGSILKGQLSLLFTQPNLETLRWDVPNLLSHVRTVLSSPSLNKESLLHFWSCYRLAELSTTDKYKAQIPGESTPTPDEISKALLGACKSTSDPTILKQLELFSASPSLDGCPMLHTMRSKHWTEAINNQFKKLSEYRIKALNIDAHSQDELERSDKSSTEKLELLQILNNWKVEATAALNQIEQQLNTHKTNVEQMKEQQFAQWRKHFTDLNTINGLFSNLDTEWEGYTY
jgi:hypothetical protein